ncbi:MAG: carbohydrate ABC transporter permease [Lachnospiraceae bacterium]|nr:carbohydrate ABC transporter permease [Lachnospiraceae bacterium]
MANEKVKVKKKRKKWTGLEFFCTAGLTLLALLIIIPFWNTIVISFSTNAAYVKSPFSLWPKEFTWDNYRNIFRNGDGLITAYKNTIFVTLVGTLAAMATMIMAAYVFSREFPGKRFLFLAAIFTMYFGGGLIPTYLLIKNLGLLNTHTSIILMSLASVYNIIIMKNGFEGVPMDLQEAAMIDGANDLKIFAKVMLPLQKPLIATFSLFTAVGFWNNWYWPMLVLNKSDKTLLQLFLKTIIESASTLKEGVAAAEDLSTMIFTMGIQMASVLCVILPIMVVYPFLQKYFVKGMLVGSVKM